jgi:membrane protein
MTDAPAKFGPHQPFIGRLRTRGMAVLGKLRPTVTNMARQTWLILRDDTARVDMGLIAAGVAFFATVSIFPALAVFVMIWSLSADPDAITALFDLGADVIPPDVLRLLSDQVTGLVSAGSTAGLSWATFLSGLFAFWCARAGVKAMVRGLRSVAGPGPQHRGWRGEVVITGLTLALYALAIVVAAAVVIAPVVLSFLTLGIFGAVAAGLLRFVIAIAAVLVALTLTYRTAVNPTVWISPGAIAATVLWFVGSVVFSIYLQNFANYNQVYGSIGAAVALLMWVYMSAYIVLLGGALDKAAAV